MDGCSSLADLNLESCKKLTADGLAEFCAHPPPMLQTLNLKYTTLESKWLLFLVAPMILLTSSLSFSALPKEIGELSKLQSLILYGCGSLKGKCEPALCSTHVTS